MISPTSCLRCSEKVVKSPSKELKALLGRCWRKIALRKTASLWSPKEAKSSCCEVLILWCINGEKVSEEMARSMMSKKNIKKLELDFKVVTP